MSIGSTIKRLRREKDITQEQLAEYLGITSRAISQWECDRTTPDISQLPALCHIFEVSSDTLLGIDIEKNNEEINQYIDRANESNNQGDFERTVVILREGLRKFPKSYAIMHELASAIVCANACNGAKDYEEVVGLCKRILAECTDSAMRYQALRTLGSAYGDAGKKKELQKLAEELPNVCFSREDFMRYRWKGDADFPYVQGYMSYLIGRVVEMLGIAAEQCHDDGSFIYSADDKIRLWETKVAFLEMMFPDGDYLFFAQFGDQACANLCSAYLEKQNYEEVWHWLEKRVDFAIHMETYDADAPHTSPALRNVLIGGWIGAENAFSRKILKWLTTDEETAALRNDKRYENLVNRLKAVAQKT